MGIAYWDRVSFQYCLEHFVNIFCLKIIWGSLFHYPEPRAIIVITVFAIIELAFLAVFIRIFWKNRTIPRACLLALAGACSPVYCYVYLSNVLSYFVYPLPITIAFYGSLWLLSRLFARWREGEKSRIRASGDGRRTAPESTGSVDSTEARPSQARLESASLSRKIKEAINACKSLKIRGPIRRTIALCCAAWLLLNWFYVMISGSSGFAMNFAPTLNPENLRFLAGEMWLRAWKEAPFVSLLTAPIPLAAVYFWLARPDWISGALLTVCGLFASSPRLFAEPAVAAYCSLPCFASLVLAFVVQRAWNRLVMVKRAAGSTSDEPAAREIKLRSPGGLAALGALAVVQAFISYFWAVSLTVVPCWTIGYFVVKLKRARAASGQKQTASPKSLVAVAPNALALIGWLAALGYAATRYIYPLAGAESVAYRVDSYETRTSMFKKGEELSVTISPENRENLAPASVAATCAALVNYYKDGYDYIKVEMDVCPTAYYIGVGFPLSYCRVAYGVYVADPGENSGRWVDFRVAADFDKTRILVNALWVENEKKFTRDGELNEEELREAVAGKLGISPADATPKKFAYKAVYAPLLADVPPREPTPSPDSPTDEPPAP